MRLSKTDWNTLDDLLGKVGFGGYYDLVEVLKTIIIKFSPSMKNAIQNETDLCTLIMVLSNIELKGETE